MFNGENWASGEAFPEPAKQNPATAETHKSNPVLAATFACLALGAATTGVYAAAAPTIAKGVEIIELVSSPNWIIPGVYLG